jgi:hypothetical protein
MNIAVLRRLWCFGRWVEDGQGGKNLRRDRQGTKPPPGSGKVSLIASRYLVRNESSLPEKLDARKVNPQLLSNGSEAKCLSTAKCDYCRNEDGIYT